jgi:predicted acetyltransferase
VTVAVRVARAEERAPVVESIVSAFGGTVRPEDDLGPFLGLFEPERILAAVDGEALVGGCGAFSFRLSVPGGGEAGCAGVTIVSVAPTHRRRGVLTEMMRRLLDDARARGEPLAALFASEGAIYGRFGFAWTGDLTIEAEARRIVFREPPEPGARLRLLSPEEALAALPPLYEAERRRRPGLLARDERWWRDHRLQDAEWSRRGGGPMFRALLELDAEPAGYALYRLHPGDGYLPALTLQAIEVLASSPVAARELWRFLFSVDLVEKVRGWFLPADDPLPLLVTEPLRLHAGLGDGLWLRLVDVEAAFAAREVVGPGAVVVDLADAFCPWNEGRWRVAAGGAARTEEPADLALGAEELAAAYLGGASVARLAAAGRARELSQGAAERADALLRTPRAPWAPEVF